MPFPDRALAIQAVVKTSLIVCNAEEQLPIAKLIESYPELLPELEGALHQANTIRLAAIKASTQVKDDPQATLHFSHRSRPDPSGLSTENIRCPICCRYVFVDNPNSSQQICCEGCGSEFALVGNPSDTEQPKKIGPFQILEPLGAGGFGVVWKGWDPELDRIVAIKVPRPASIQRREMEAFMAEARFVAQLRHPGIVRIYQVGREGDRVFIVSDYIDGPPLTDWISEGGVSCEEAAALCIEVADALEHAHRAGIIHRDLKPANILLDRDGKPHITDFGLAIQSQQEIRVDAEGQIIGTPAYMSPEQAAGKVSQVDVRSDIYSLGTVLFELLTGERPFRGDMRVILHRVVHDIPPRPRELRRSIPRDLDNIVLKCLQKDPGRRYASAAELARDLRNWSSGEPILARALSPMERLQRWCLRNSLVAMGLCSAILMLVFLTVGMIVVARQKQMDLQAAINELNNQQETPAPEVQNLGNALEELAARLEAEPALPQNWSQAEKLLKDSFETLRLKANRDSMTIESIHLQDHRGVMRVIHPPSEKILQRNFSQRDYFRGPMRRNQAGIYISRPYRSERDGLYKIAIARRISLPNSTSNPEKMVGVLSASIATPSTRAIAREDQLARLLILWAGFALLPVLGFAGLIAWSEYRRSIRRAKTDPRLMRLG